MLWYIHTLNLQLQCLIINVQYYLLNVLITLSNVILLHQSVYLIIIIIIIIRWWLGLDTSGGSLCPHCPDIALDPLGHHAASCRHGGDVVARHNRLRDIFAKFCRRAHLSVRVEVGYGLARDHVNSRPANVLVQGWDRGKPAAFDVTGRYCCFTPYTSNPQQCQYICGSSSLCC